MQIILLERIGKIGAIGDVVSVKDGYARNFLLPRKKALRATPENQKTFKKKRKEIEEKYIQFKQKAIKDAELFKKLSVTLIRQASEDGRLYGSVTSSDIMNELNKKLKKEYLLDAALLPQKFKDLGVYEIDINLHPEVLVKLIVSVARTEEESKLNIKKFFQKNSVEIEKSDKKETVKEENVKLKEPKQAE